jgi:VIT1/CCC1 family predicted Fe2+/Mn2+ transporter
MDTTHQRTMERRAGTERRRNTSIAVNPMMEVRAPTIVDGARRISWGAIVGGVILALVTQLALSLLGLATGVSTASGRPGLVTAIWMVASAVIALLVGGATASRLAGVEPRDGVVHGLLTWGLMALVAFFLVTTAVGRLVSFSADDLTRGLSRIGSGVATGVDPVTERMKDVTELNDATGGLSDIAPRPEPENPDNPTGASMARVPVGTAAFWAFIGLCVGALSAALGGYVGAPRWRTQRRVIGA